MSVEREHRTAESFHLGAFQSLLQQRARKECEFCRQAESQWEGTTRFRPPRSEASKCRPSSPVASLRQVIAQSYLYVVRTGTPRQEVIAALPAHPKSRPAFRPAIED